MQVQSGINFNTVNQNSFGATKIDSVNLLKRVSKDKFTPIKANFNELHFDDVDDIKLIYKLKEKWGNLAEYSSAICNDFLKRVNDYRYFAVEALDGGKKKITNLAEVEIRPCKKPNKYSCHVMFLQSAPDIAEKAGTTPIKGSGELAMYEIVKMAKKMKCKNVKLVSTADGFYQNIGMKDMSKGPSVSIFGLKSSDFKKFMKRIEEKYNLKK